jgi:transcriptional regulator with XRE-family HTH domain
MDLRGVSAAFRAVRLHKGWRQIDVARAAGVARSTVSRAETTKIRTLHYHTIEQIADALEIRLDIRPRWRGGELDRLLNAGHSALHESMAGILHGAGWLFRPEVSFSIYGERGIIDTLAFHPASDMLLVIELKTAIIDVQGLIGSVDRYERLAPRIAAGQGWRPRLTSCWVVVMDSATNRRRVAAHASVLRAAFPTDGRSIRPWLMDPTAPLRCLSFLAAGHIGGRARVRRVRNPADR